MPEISADPYRNFRFRVLLDGVAVAGLSKMSAVKRTTETVEWREAGGNSTVRKMPGRSKMEPITLEAGLTQSTQFLEWAEQVSNPTGDGGTLANFRKPVTVQVLNMQGVAVKAFTLDRAWPSEFQATPEMDANANAVAITILKLEYESFSIDRSVKEPT